MLVVVGIVVRIPADKMGRVDLDDTAVWYSGSHGLRALGVEMVEGLESDSTRRRDGQFMISRSKHQPRLRHGNQHTSSLISTPPRGFMAIMRTSRDASNADAGSRLGGYRSRVMVTFTRGIRHPRGTN